MGVGSERERVCTTGFLLALLVSTAQAFIEFPYNKTHQFGPDGPWQAVSLGIKYPSDSAYTTVNVYPSVLYDTIAALYVPTQKACYNDTTGQCAVGGTIGSLGPANGSYSWYTYFNDATGFYFYLNGTTAYTDVELPNNVYLTNALTDVCSFAQMTYPGGNTLPVEVGYGGLGASPIDKSESAPLALYKAGNTQSNSYGLHIGSAPLGYPGSLIFGGYDRGRVLGPVIEYDAHSPLSLIDVEIGVETGESPFNFDMQTDLLKIPPSSGFSGTLPTLVKPEYPYIFLNQPTLDAIAQNLPISFDSKSGFYLWNTQDPSYAKIVSSPAYLSFVFPSVTGTTTNTTIKVPFKLLNLTLESSASGLSSDVAYFPVMATEIGGDLGLDLLLGRAFLQSAFIGTNWAANTSWLAQAPGPGSSMEGLGYDPVDLDGASTSLNIQSGDSLFKQSWAGHWTVISAKSSSGGGSSGSGGSGDSGSTLSGGAIAGIVIGAVAAIAIIAAIVAFVLLRKNKRRAREAAGPPSGSNVQPYYTDKPQGPPHQGPPFQELHSDPPHRGELDSQGHYKPYNNLSPQQQYEMPAGYQYPGELPGHYEPHELPANPKPA